jgi:hypothetical protein
MTRNSTDIIDDALGIANECGWRYALAYLISEGVSPQIIQRLLIGRTRPTSSERQIAFVKKNCGWRRQKSVEIVRLFESPCKLRSDEIDATNYSPSASRVGVSPTEDD